MATTGRDYSWLPEHQHHVIATLAHVDKVIEQAGRVLHGHLQPPGPLELDTVPDGELAHVIVVSVAPLPQAVARLTADALTQLRAAIEHTLYAEVQHQLGRQLTEAEERRIEMPACVTAEGFTKWLKERKRQDLAPLIEGSPLARRLRDLQPYHRRDPDLHPLRVLAEHTNLAKHRTPAVAATQLGAVIPDKPDPELLVASGEPRPVAAGDVLASSPLYKRIPLSIWPKVSVQRPHTATWHVLNKELGDLEDWTRTVAIPHLVTGSSDVDQLPPQLDISIGHSDLMEALSSAGTVPAAKRSLRRIEAATARQGLVETLALHPTSPGPQVLQAWANDLSDDEVLSRQQRLGLPAKTRDYRAVDAVVHELLLEAKSHDGDGQSV